MSILLLEARMPEMVQSKVLEQNREANGTRPPRASPARRAPGRRRARGEHLVDDGPVAHQRLVQQVLAPEGRAFARRYVAGRASGEDAAEELLDRALGRGDN
eukprot:scaffold63365_cov71-Phaeocystis_antarctica.AAC.3